ncbi:MAG: hypothetical protein LBL66_05840, partial [Clostridiales bacterium]|nr:hypothetical protein [Clostridiales bacterium]
LKPTKFFGHSIAMSKKFRQFIAVDCFKPKSRRKITRENVHTVYKRALDKFRLKALHGSQTVTYTDRNL